MSLTYGLTSVVHIPHVERPKCPHDAYPIIFNFGRALHYGLPTARDVKKDLGFEISDLTLFNKCSRSPVESQTERQYPRQVLKWPALFLT